MGIGLIFGYTLQGATWLVLKTEGDLQQWSRRMAHYALFGVLAFILLISLWQFIVPPSVTLWDAFAAPLSHQFLLIGTMFLLPVIVIYVIWSYWVFRGKVRGDMDYHAE